MPIPFIKTASGSITAFVNGRNLQVPSDHRYYNEILNAIRTDNAEEFAKLADLSESLTRFIHKNSAGEEVIKVEDGLVYYRGSEIHNTVTERILDFMKQNLPVEPLILFLENLLLNPSRHSVQQLHRFLENQKLPITEDGCFLAYKRVNNQWRDFHSNTIDNSIGSEPFMIRNEVDDDFSHDCSHGLHVGAINYVRGFHSGDGHIIVVKVNPQDAVSVPQYDNTKMRVCKYKVIEEVSPESLGLSESLYAATTVVTPVAGSPVAPPPVVDDEFESDEDQWDEEEDEEDEEEEENDDDADGDWDEEEEAEELEASDVPLSIRVWAESKNIDVEFFEKDWSSSYSKHLAKALEEKDGVSALQYLYAIAIEEDDADVQQVLENPEDKRDFIDLVKSL